MTSGKEDYLKAIYIISESHELVTNKELSEMLHVSPPSVSEMIAKLQKQGYVDYTAYKGSRMTKKGRREAGRLMRYHALWEVFLVKCLHFSWSGAHDWQKVSSIRRMRSSAASLMHIWEIRSTARTVIRSLVWMAAGAASRAASLSSWRRARRPMCAASWRTTA